MRRLANAARPRSLAGLGRATRSDSRPLRMRGRRPRSRSARARSQMSGSRAICSNLTSARLLFLSTTILTGACAGPRLLSRPSASRRLRRRQSPPTDGSGRRLRWRTAGPAPSTPSCRCRSAAGPRAASDCARRSGVLAPQSSEMIASSAIRRLARIGGLRRAAPALAAMSPRPSSEGSRAGQYWTFAGPSRSPRSLYG
jgi:hypothetical protein